MPNYIDIIRRFRTAHRLNPFSSVQYALFMELLGECNYQGWPSKFQLPPRFLETSIRNTRKYIYEARRELIRRGFITYTPATSKSSAFYTICFDVDPYGYAENPDESAPDLDESANSDCSNDDIYCRQDEINGDLNKNAEGNIEGNTEGNTEGNMEGNTEGNTYKNLNKTKEKKPKGLKKKAPENGEKLSGKTSALRSKRRDLSAAETLQLYRRETESAPYASFLDWLQQNAPYVAEHIYTLTEREFEALRHHFGSQSIVDNVLNLENRKDLRKRYKSLYLTLLNWCKNERK